MNGPRNFLELKKDMWREIEAYFASKNNDSLRSGRIAAINDILKEMSEYDKYFLDVDNLLELAETCGYGFDISRVNRVNEVMRQATKTIKRYHRDNEVLTDDNYALKDEVAKLRIEISKLETERTELIEELMDIMFLGGKDA